MGYRSEVVIVVPRDSKQAILDIIPLEDWNKVHDNDHDDYGNDIKTTLFRLREILIMFYDIADDNYKKNLTYQQNYFYKSTNNYQFCFFCSV